MLTGVMFQEEWPCRGTPGAVPVRMFGLADG